MIALVYYSFLLSLFVGIPARDSPALVGIPDHILEYQPAEFDKKGGSLFHKNELFSGYLEKCFASGALKSLAPYLDGKLEGWKIEWYENGQLKEKRFYHNNYKEGRHLGWWTNGKLKFDYQFSEDLYEGICKEWFESGDLYRYFNYENGREQGKQQMWYIDGKIRANYVVKNGRRYGLTGAKLCVNVKNPSNE